MAKTLVVYHSRTGYTRRVAHALANRLGADLEEIRIVQPLDGALGYFMCAVEALAGLAPALRPARRSPTGYSLVVVGTPVWFWSLSSPARSWLEKHPLKGKRFAFFCTMGGSGAARAFSEMQRLAGGAPVTTLALTDGEVDADLRAKADAFVRELRGTRPSRRSAPPGVAHAAT